MTPACLLVLVFAAVVIGCRGDSPRTQEVLSGDQLRKQDPAAMRAIQAGFEQALRGSQIQQCYSDWLAHRAPKAFDGTTFDVRLTVESKDGEARVLEVLGADWPVAFDETVRSCIGDELSRARFASKHSFHVSVVYPVCFRTGGSSRAASPQAHEQTVDCPAASYEERSEPMRTFFASEPRDESWAAGLEQRLRADDLLIVECHCRCCLLVTRCDDRASCNEWRAELSEGWSTRFSPLGFKHMFIDGNRAPDVVGLSAQAIICQ